MDFFEVLIILVFVLIPILEGVFKQRRKKELPGDAPAPQRREPASVGAGQESGGGAGVEGEGPAADMIPADLWEVLTGERRPEAPRSERPPWETPEWAGEEEVAADEIGGTATEEGWISAPWEEERREPVSEPEYREPVSLEYVGPEAISLEQPLQPPEVRHVRFHEKYDDVFAAPPPTGRRDGGISRELREGLHGAGLRRSILLAEILGPPKGLV